MLGKSIQPMASHLRASAAGRLCRRFGAADTVAYQNVYHCCTHRTGSAWFKAMFRDPAFFNRTGLDVVGRRPLAEASLLRFTRPLPRWTVARLSVDFATYQRLPKPRAFKTFFVMRDPRELVLAWYASLLQSKAAQGPEAQHRKAIDRLSVNAGLRYCTDLLETLGVFNVQRSWASAARSDEKLKLVRYEDLLADPQGFLRNLFLHLEVSMPRGEREALAARYPLAVYGSSTLTRQLAPVPLRAKPNAKGWRRWFTPEVEQHFVRVTGDLIEELGYAVHDGQSGVIRPSLAA